ncbi:16S rRNA (uracil(1498)-N(3))-methyltransferase (plasmid) [Pedobacter sp. BS3]|uniref:16S rRNA (uracil(1498)-N(3))-methyltransferase n=1 Tax=Pedobacter sp. BS3 TaxID=2567937 RepID=UPI0011F02AFE|nr:16S rRNA (uracil(1498)-N(3))-methyltransferase [Pedobacter sp. BS3]TZF86355.1 16S rRNA (uracil(1498)-N(3))-methyltransferase [Pedobacter sp. BS3]
MHIFYTPDIVPDAAYELNEEESKHCVRVLRLQQGDEIVLVDGKGGFFNAVIENIHPRKVSVAIVHSRYDYGKRNHYLHIAIAPTKNIERIEWFLEKATEIGVDEVSFIICDRSERKDIKLERLNKIITAAVKQSIKAYHPRLNEAVKYKTFLQQKPAGQKFIAHCIDAQKSYVKDLMNLNGTYTVLIGPEGDFTPAEVDAALQAGYQPVTLGESRLRTETAALEACFEFNFLNR